MVAAAAKVIESLSLLISIARARARSKLSDNIYPIFFSFFFSDLAKCNLTLLLDMRMIHFWCAESVENVSSMRSSLYFNNGARTEPKFHDTCVIVCCCRRCCCRCGCCILRRTIKNQIVCIIWRLS